MTKVEFDLDANAAYFRLREGKVSKTEESNFDSLELLLDYDRHDNIVGIEVLNLKRLLEFYFAPWIPSILERKAIGDKPAEAATAISRLIQLANDITDLAQANGAYVDKSPGHSLSEIEGHSFETLFKRSFDHLNPEESAIVSRRLQAALAYRFLFGLSVGNTLDPDSFFLKSYGRTLESYLKMTKQNLLKRE